MKGWGRFIGMVFVGLLALPVYGAEYQGRSVDGRRLSAKVYSYETGGVFDAQVVFQRKWATLYFVNGSEQKVRLRRSRITNPAEIYGWSVGLLNIGGIFNVGIAKDSPNNLEPSGPRPFERMWRISLKDADLQ
ncbi:MAG TPA: hypothetical protein V6D19_10475 [Stenomitos sp.]